MSLETAIERTIKYGREYGCEFSSREIIERLISRKVYSDGEVKKFIKFESLSSFKAKNPAEDKIKKAEELVKKYLRGFVDVLMVGVTGSVAAGHPKKNDDIDLMIITRKNKLWLTRLRLRWFVYRNGIPHRKYGREEKKDEFCFNFWLDDEALKLSKKRRNLKNAMDLILIKPILNRESIYERFVLENDWAKKWVATGYSRKVCQVIKFVKLKDDFIQKIINFLVFVPQYLFMRKKIKDEEIGLHKAIFC